MDPSAAARLHNLAWSGATVAFIIVGSLVLAQIARLIARWRGLSVGEQNKVFWGYLFASPWILGFVIFVLGPALASLYYSFTNYRLGQSYRWVGLENYRILLEGVGAHGRRFIQAMYNSFYYALVGVPLQIVTALGMAMLLQRQLPGIGLFRLIFYLPVILAGGPAILLAWRYMLAANSGFINLSLQAFADSFFLFNWFYLGFIYVVEALNGFYGGITRGDPVGPLAYTLPAVVGAAVLLTLLRGEWTTAKEDRAWKVAEIIGTTLAVVLLARAVVAQPIDPALIVALGLAAAGAALSFMLRGRSQQASRWVWGGLVVLAAALAISLLVGGGSPYVLTCAVTAAPLVVALSIGWRRQVLTAGVVVLAGLLLIRLAPGQLDGGRLAVLLDYVLLRSALAQADSLDYLRSFAATGPSPFWLYGLIALVTGSLALSASWTQRLRKGVVGAALAFFSLLALGSLLDGLRYFQAFETVAQATSAPNYHFSLFRQVTASFPEAGRVPLWLGNELWSRPSLVLITMWSSGAGMLIFLAALKGVPRALYEAADVDGASPWQKFVSITLPMISPAMFYNVVIGMITALQTFEIIYILQTPQTEGSLASTAYFLFIRTFRQLEIAQGAAASWILAVIIVLITVFQFRYSRWVHYEA